MTKNAVQRLQRINRQLKSVISIYDAVDTSSTQERDPDETILLSDNTNALLRSELNQTSSLETKEKNFSSPKKLLEENKKKCTGFGSKNEYNFLSSEPSVWTTTRKNSTWLPVKPSSAPSYTSSSTGQYESNIILGSSQSTNNCNKTKIKKILTSETKASFENENLKLISSQKQIKPVSNKNCIKQKKETSESEQLYEMVPSKATDFSDGSENNAKFDRDIQRAGKNYPAELSKQTKAFATNKSCKSCRSRSESPRKDLMYDPSELESLKRPVTGKNGFEASKAKLMLKGSQCRPENSKKIPRLEKKKSLECLSKKRNCWPRADSQDRKNKQENVEVTISSSNNKNKENANSDKTNGNIWYRKTGEKKALGHTKGLPERETESKERNEAGHSPKMDQSERLESSKFEAQELSKIIEKSNEKLEKMKFSKNLAIDIAKQLKNKYEEIKNSKNKLMNRLQEVEKDNERLNFEVEKEKNSKIKLQKDLDVIKTESRTLLFEQEAKSQEILEENACLKEKLMKMEMERFEQLMRRKKADSVEVKEKCLNNSTDFNQSFHEESTNNPYKQREAIQIQILSSEDSSKVKKEKRCVVSEEFHDTEGDIRKLISENSQLLLKIQELSNTLQDKQYRINSLEDKTKELEHELKRQKHHLQQKTEKLEETNKELESIRKNSRDLEEQVKSLRQNIEYFDQMHQEVIGKSSQYESQIKKLQDKVEQLETDKEKVKRDLENEKDSLLIKNKIIDDQQETIKQLREKSEGIKNLMKKNQSLERLINIERDEKMELQNAIEHLKCRKEELKRKIKSLEGDLLLAPQEVVRDLQKTQLVLHELENQVQIKQKEWQFHLQSLIKEKEQACSVAEFATKKLIETTNEFQKQSEAHKRLNKVLAENLAEKERYLKEMNEKISQSQLKGMLVDADFEKKRFFRPTFSEEKGTEIQGRTHGTSDATFIAQSWCRDNEKIPNFLLEFE